MPPGDGDADDQGQPPTPDAIQPELLAQIIQMILQQQQGQGQGPQGPQGMPPMPSGGPQGQPMQS
ncbi:hypothetical protein CCP3SC5AM1_2870004 [Gammaproteobacteria bacterium]